MSTSKGTIQGYNGITINDDKHQVILQAQTEINRTDKQLSCTDKIWGKIDSGSGRREYSKRLGAIEPVFGNITVNKGMNKFMLRGQAKVNAQWQIYCLVHNIEKLRSHLY